MVVESTRQICSCDNTVFSLADTGLCKDRRFDSWFIVLERALHKRKLFSTTESQSWTKGTPVVTLSGTNGCSAISRKPIFEKG